MKAYLDNSATTRQYDEVTELMLKCIRDDFGNPSSLHRMGMEAEKYVDRARKQAAGAITAMSDISADPAEIFFTSGGTESDNTALICGALSRKRAGRRVITTAIEHPAVLESCKRLEEEGFEIVYAQPGSDGTVSADIVAGLINDDTVLVSVMHVNNETGAIQPVEEIAAQCVRKSRVRGQEILFHTDAVQSFGKVRLPLKNVDMLSISGHKIHGPKGVGILYIGKDRGKDLLNIKPFIVGGGQEKGFRSGTENVPAVAGLGLAAEMTAADFESGCRSIRHKRDRLRTLLEENVPDIRINTPSDSEESSPGILNVSFRGTRGEVLLHTLEQDGIFVSTGSACSSNKRAQPCAQGAGMQR